MKTVTISELRANLLKYLTHVQGGERIEVTFRDGKITEAKASKGQDIFLNLYRALPSYDAMRPLQPWIMTIARNKLREYGIE